MTAEIEGKFTKWAIGILTTGLIGAFTWAWNLNADIAVMESRMLQDSNSKQTADEVLKNWSSLKSTQESHARQLQNLWKHLNAAQEKEIKWENRVSRIESKLDYCCD